MSFEKNIGKQFDFQKELDEAGSHEDYLKKKKQESQAPKAIIRGEVDDPWDSLGPNYKEQKDKQIKRAKQEAQEAKRRKKTYQKDRQIKRRNFDNQY